MLMGSPHSISCRVSYSVYFMCRAPVLKRPAPFDIDAGRGQLLRMTPELSIALPDRTGGCREPARAQSRSVTCPRGPGGRHRHDQDPAAYRTGARTGLVGSRVGDKLPLLR